MLRLYSLVHGAMESTKTSHFTRQSKSFISIYFITQVSTCELQPFSCHDLANYIYSQTASSLFSHLIGACQGKSYRIHSSSTDQRIRNPVSLESRIQDCVRLQGRGIKYCLADQKYWAIKMILFKFQIRLVFRSKLNKPLGELENRLKSSHFHLIETTYCK